MSAHTFTAGGGVPLNDDVDMEDLNVLAQALPEEKASTKPNDECDDIHTSNDATQVSPGVPTAHITQDHEGEAMNGLPTATAISAEPEATPNNTIGDDEAARLRLELFASTFDGQKVELKNFATPPQCAQYPAQSQDILEAYLDRSIFTVKTWINFDPVEEVFFEGARAADCGKLQIPQAKLDYLLGLDPREFNFLHIHFEIGTPFRTLAIIRLNIREKGDIAYLEAKGNMVKQYPPRPLPLLQSYFAQFIKQLNKQDIDRNLDMQDLVDIAQCFRREPKHDQRADEWEEPSYGFGEWVGIEAPRRSSLGRYN
jgi:hypothetical protein